MKGPKKYHAKKSIQVIYLITPRSAFLLHEIVLLVSPFNWSCALKDNTLRSKKKLMRRLILVKGPKKYHAKKSIQVISLIPPRSAFLSHQLALLVTLYIWSCALNDKTLCSKNKLMRRLILVKGPKKHHAKKRIQVIYLIPPRSAFLSHQLALLVTLYIWSCALKDKTLHSKNKLMRRLILVKGPKKYHAKKGIRVISLIPSRSAFLSPQLALLVTLYIWSCVVKNKTLRSKNKLMRRLILVKGPKKYHAKKSIHVISLIPPRSAFLPH